MDRETEIKIIARSFDLVEDIVCKCFKTTEEATRAAIKAEVLERYERIGDDVIEKTSLMEAYKKLEAMDYIELAELVELLGGAEDLEEEKSLREKFYSTEYGDKFVLYDDNGEPVRYIMKLRFTHKGRDFCMAVSFENLEIDDCCPDCDFFEFIRGEHLEDDRLIKITDDALDRELSNAVYDMYHNDDDDED